MKDGPNIARIAALIGDHARAEMLTRADGRPGAHRHRAGRHGRRRASRPQRAPREAARRAACWRWSARAPPLLPARRRRRRAAARKPDGRGVSHRRRAPALEPARAGAAQGTRLLRPPGRRSGRAGVRQPAAAQRSCASASDGLAADARPARDWFCATSASTSMRSPRSAGRCAAPASTGACGGITSAGAVGAALLQRMFALGWARRVKDSRVVAFTPPGEVALRRRFGVGA